MDKQMLSRAQEYANKVSGCDKVKVGAVATDQHGRAYYGANRVIPNACQGIDSCQTNGHCTSTIHAEVDAIVRAKTNLSRGTIYVTRYPCESCARAIVTAGIKTVIYGRDQPISSETARIFDSNGVNVKHVKE